jgi:hypothetical protein
MQLLLLSNTSTLGKLIWEPTWARHVPYMVESLNQEKIHLSAIIVRVNNETFEMRIGL